MRARMQSHGTADVAGMLPSPPVSVAGPCARVMPSGTLHAGHVCMANRCLQVAECQWWVCRDGRYMRSACVLIVLHHIPPTGTAAAALEHGKVTRSEK